MLKWFLQRNPWTYQFSSKQLWALITLFWHKNKLVNFAPNYASMELHPTNGWRLKLDQAVSIEAVSLSPRHMWLCSNLSWLFQSRLALCLSCSSMWLCWSPTTTPIRLSCLLVCMLFLIISIFFNQGCSLSLTSSMWAQHLRQLDNLRHCSLGLCKMIVCISVTN